MAIDAHMLACLVTARTKQVSRSVANAGGSVDKLDSNSDRYGARRRLVFVGQSSRIDVDPSCAITLKSGGVIGAPHWPMASGDIMDVETFVGSSSKDFGMAARTCQCAGAPEADGRQLIILGNS